jgi:transcriptional regulator with XRE-family HTH domain
MSLPVQSLQPWLLQIEPYPEESFGHFLGRFRRANLLRSRHLSAMLGVRDYTVSYWETPSRRRTPSEKELKQLCEWSGIEETRLRAMWAPKGCALHLSTRLCAGCYGKAPYHKWTWQRENKNYCEQHQKRLLPFCPRCGSYFLIPAYWEGECDRCRLSFKEMVSYQH